MFHYFFPSNFPFRTSPFLRECNRHILLHRIRIEQANNAGRFCFLITLMGRDSGGSRGTSWVLLLWNVVTNAGNLRGGLVYAHQAIQAEIDKLRPIKLESLLSCDSAKRHHEFAECCRIEDQSTRSQNCINKASAHTPHLLTYLTSGRWRSFFFCLYCPTCFFIMFKVEHQIRNLHPDSVSSADL